MEQIQEPAEQRSGEMREEIDSTRADLAVQLEALENRVMGSVESAQETVEDSIQIAKDTVETVKRTFDFKSHIEHHPWTVVGGSFLAGLALVTLFPRVGRRTRQAERETAYSARAAPVAEQRRNGLAAEPLPHYQALPKSPGMFDLLHDEIAKVKGMAIGYFMGLARDAIKDAAPQWSPQVDEVMNSAITKLGGQIVQQQTT